MGYRSLNLQRLLLYRQLLHDETIQKVRQLLASTNDLQYSIAREETYYDISYQLIQSSHQQIINGDLWKSYILNLIVSDENVFSLACEHEGVEVNKSIFNLAIHDMQILKALYSLDWFKLGSDLGVECSHILADYKSTISNPNNYSSYYLYCLNNIKPFFSENVEVNVLAEKLAEFYHTVGIGQLGKYAAFKWENGLTEISNHDPVQLEDLVGYEYQKWVLTKNTEAFLNQEKANHILLYGNKGTGKSSSVKALLNRYAKAGLRMIELSKDQLRDFGKILSILKGRGYYFIIFIDDLSFEDFEVEYKNIKSSIEGSLEVTPDNVLIYVTSNRRNLIKENWKDRQNIDEEVHTADSQQEKLSLADRFGITLSYDSPAQEQFLKIVAELAIRSGLNIDAEELRRGALEWERRFHGRSGRTAHQYINQLKHKL